MAFLNSTVLGSSLHSDDPQHAACSRLLMDGLHHVYSRALAELFSALTGGRLGRRVRPAVAASLVEGSVLPDVTVQMLSAKDLMTALQACELRGARGGAVSVWLQLAATGRRAQGRRRGFLHPEPARLSSPDPARRPGAAGARVNGCNPPSNAHA